MTIGICGTGKMGSAIAERLMDEGETVTVWNRTRERAQALLERGAGLADSPAALAGECDAVIVMLLDDAALHAVYEGEGGLLAAAPAGRLIVEMSTVRPATVAALAQKVRATGASFVECPVGGTVAPARAGKLLGMAGGSAEDVARARSLLEKLCRRVEHVGAPGCGAAMKLAINLPLIVYWEALGEALSLCEGAGISRELAGDILADSSGAIGVAKPRIPSILAALGGAEPTPANFALSASVKDLELATEAAGGFGARAPVAEAALGAYREAVANGWGDRDFPMQAAWRARQRGA
jgi:3-hydroxyisobutyrate dehydrogenase